MNPSEVEKYAQQAAMYEQLACYYKYINPQKYMELYLKHYNAMKQFVQAYEQSRISLPHSSEQSLPSQVRILHASPDAPTVDIVINGQKVVKNISFKQHSPYLSLTQGQYRIDIVPAGDETPIFSALVPVMGNHVYTLAVAGNVDKLQLLPLIDNTPLPYGQAKIRFVHLSPDTPEVDVALKDGEKLFEKAAFKQVIDFLQVSPGVADIEVSVAGTKNVVLTIPEVKIEGNKIYTIVALGYANKSPKLETVFLTN
ncbi:DUF4397 domain-containing protein [Bacillus sp. 3103sda1]|uniref:DUF4397 domain-containing protein n=1 Tax=Bacillus sp. 3103sda1 TaxID=2953808 RepID=UPI00209FF485|nr:DUF4397 domain-containing protein [Bacillus sp. 3103sda1]MCP1123641.1 DUF4397 domain-containing protein [Bacillus sp. 3103sda1]